MCLVSQSCPILCNFLDYNPPGSSVRGIFQERILELGAISFSRDSSQLRDWSCTSCVSCTAGGFFTCWAIKGAKLTSTNSLFLRSKILSHFHIFIINSYRVLCNLSHSFQSLVAVLWGLKLLYWMLWNPSTGGQWLCKYGKSLNFSPCIFNVPTKYSVYFLMQIKEWSLPFLLLFFSAKFFKEKAEQKNTFLVENICTLCQLIWLSWADNFHFCFMYRYE